MNYLMQLLNSTTLTWVSVCMCVCVCVCVQGQKENVIYFLDCHQTGLYLITSKEANWKEEEKEGQLV